MATITKAQAKQAAKLATGKDLAKMTKAELLGTYYNEARNADIRLSNLEKLSTQAGYKTATEWAYARAIKDIENIHGEGAIRFDKALPAKVTKSQIRAYINDIRTFRAAPSSTKTGIDKVYKKRAETINKKYNTGLTWQEIAQVLEDGSYQSLNFESNQAWIVLGKKFKANIKKQKEMIKTANDRVKRLDRQEALKTSFEELQKNKALSIHNL